MLGSLKPSINCNVQFDYSMPDEKVKRKLSHNSVLIHHIVGVLQFLEAAAWNSTNFSQQGGKKSYQGLYPW